MASKNTTLSTGGEYFKSCCLSLLGPVELRAPCSCLAASFTWPKASPEIKAISSFLDGSDFFRISISFPSCIIFWEIGTAFALPNLLRSVPPRRRMSLSRIIIVWMPLLARCGNTKSLQSLDHLSRQALSIRTLHNVTCLNNPELSPSSHFSIWFCRSLWL